MIAAFGDFYIGGGPGGGEDAGGGVVVEVLGEGGGGTVPGLAGEAALLLAEVAFGAAGVAGVDSALDVVAGVGEGLVSVCGAGFGEGLDDAELRGYVALYLWAGVLVDGAGGAVDQLLGDRGLVDQVAFEEGAVGLGVGLDGGLVEVLGEDVEGGVAGGGEASGGEDGFQFAGSDDCVHFRDVLLDLVAVTLYQAAGYDDALGFAAVLLLVLDHLEDGVDRLLLGGVDEAAGVDDDDLGVFGPGGEFGSVVVEEAHHDL